MFFHSYQYTDRQLDVANSNNNGELEASNGWSNVEIEYANALVFLTPTSHTGMALVRVVARGLPTRSENQCRKRYNEFRTEKAKARNREIQTTRTLVQSSAPWRSFYRVKVKLLRLKLYQTLRPPSDVAASFMSKYSDAKEEEERVMTDVVGASSFVSIDELGCQDPVVSKSFIHDKTVSITADQVRRSNSVIVVNMSHQINNKAIIKVLNDVHSDGSWKALDESRQAGAIEVSSLFIFDKPPCESSQLFCSVLSCNRFCQGI